MLSDRTLTKLQGIRQCSINGYKARNLFQIALNAPDLWQEAYSKLANNEGATTTGSDGLTIDGYSDERASNLRELLREDRYIPTPARRVYIPKSNGKLRPLGLPNPNDKQVQEVWHMILEAIYEPVFSTHSHGYRPNRSCHTALSEIKHTWTGVRWFIEFDIEGYFDNIDHEILMGILEKKIDDAKFLAVIRKMLKAGYMENWQYHKTHSGTPQGGIISPLLANIYLHELDRYVETLRQSFTQGKERAAHNPYAAMAQRKARLHRRIEASTDAEERTALIVEKKDVHRQLLEMPSNDMHDPNYRRLLYCRYADDFVLGIMSPKVEAEAIYKEIQTFLQETLKLNISVAKSGLKHNTETIRFLGYDITITNSTKTVKCKVYGQHTKKRSMTGTVTLFVPPAKMQAFAERCQYGNWHTMDAMHKAFLMNASDAEIALHYTAEMRGIAQYYSLAANFSSALGRLRILGIRSCLKTLAAKHQKSVQQIATMLNRGEYLAVEHTGKDGKRKQYKLFRLKDVKRVTATHSRSDSPPPLRIYTVRSELNARLEANSCEYCGKEGGYYEVHHVRKLADIKGKEPWERLMIARKRKTLVLCITCHDLLHAGKLPDRRKDCHRVESRVR